MKRVRGVVLAFVVAISGLITASSAAANGTCTAHSGQLQVSTEPSVVATGNASCTVNHTMTVSVSIYARPGGGGTWNRIKTSTSGTSFTNFKSWGATYQGYNCAKDYKSITSFAASNPDEAHSGSDNSPIYQNTC